MEELTKKFFDLVLNSTKDAVVLADETGIVIFWNKSVERILGYRMEEVLGKPLWETMIPIEYIDRVIGGFEKFKRTGHLERSLRVTARRKDGSYIPVEVSLSSVSFEGKNYIIAVIRDISDKVKLEEEIEDLRDIYRLIVESASDVIFVVDEDGYFKYINPSIEKFGYKASEILGRKIFDFLGELSLGDSEIYEFNLRTKDGEFRSFQVTTKPTFRGAGFVGVMRDVTKRKRMEELLEKIVEYANVGIYVLGKRGFEYANPKFLEMVSYSIDELNEVGLLNLVHPEDRSKFIEEFAELALGNDVKFEVRVVSKDCVVRLFEFSSVPLNDRIIGIVRDVSERRKLEEELRESEEMFRTIAENSLVGIYLLQDGIVKYANPKLSEIVGLDLEEIVGRDPYDFIHPEDVEHVRENVKLLKNGGFSSYKFRIVSGDGSIKTVETLASFILYKGKPAIVGTILDRTEEEMNKKKLGEYERFYKNAQDMFFIVDGRGRFVDVNLRFAEMLGYSKDELIGRTARRLVAPEELDHVRENFRKAMRGEKVVYEARAVAKDGREYMMEVTLWPIVKDGKVVGAEGILRDITKRKELEMKLKENEEKYRKIFEGSPNMISIVDEDGKIVEVNQKVIESIGFDPTGLSVFEIFPEKIARGRMLMLKTVLEQNRSIVFDGRIKDRFYTATAVPLELLGKKHCLVIATDVTRIVSYSKLLGTVNKISRIIMHERNITNLLQRACEELASLEDHYHVWIGLFEGDYVRIVASSNQRTGRVLEIADCITNAVFNGLDIRDPSVHRKCRSCKFRPRKPGLICVTLPLITDGRAIGVIKLISEVGKPMEEELEVLETLANDLAFAIKSLELEEERITAARQIERNIEQFAYLTDRIRNPLAAIVGYAEMNEKFDDIFEKIIQQARRIDMILEEIDEVWRESENTKRVLTKFNL